MSDLSIKGTNSLSDDYFQVTGNGSDTFLTLEPGNPIDLAVNGPLARQNYDVNGNGIRIGIVSGTLSDGENEALAMRDIIAAIAPGSTIITESAQPSEANVASDITYFATPINQGGAGCNIIVDDWQFPGEASTGSLIDTAIDNAVNNCDVTYFTLAGNTPEVGPNIIGHSLDPNAITVGAINLLATPTSVGGYLAVGDESYSAAGPTGSGKPDISAPDGGPTSFALNGALNPFFGTSAAAPAAAAVAALAMQR